jgi:phosphatidate cytidylyltransferase
LNYLLKPAVALAMLNDGDDQKRSFAQAAGAASLGGQRRRRLTDLLPRVVSSLVLATAAITAVGLGGMLFAVTWFVAALAVGWEWQNLIGAARARLRVLILAAALGAACYFVARGNFLSACGVLALAGLLAGLAAGRGRELWAFAGIFYAGALIIAVNVLYASPAFGSRAIFWLFGTVWGTDVFAYFGGRLIGGPKLWPQISPSKTWSGTLCGVLAGALIGALIGAQGLGDERIGLPIFALGLVTASVAQGGDLVESIIKRRFGVKDSGSLIPGHGGFMDRLDGFLAAAAFAALFGALRHGIPNAAAALFDWP